MRMLFRRILVPHDFSAPATRALQLAASLAAGARGRLIVLNAIVPYVPVTAAPGAQDVPWVPPAELVAAERRRLDRLVTRTLGRRRRGLRAECRVVIGDPLDRIIDAARAADSIVMSTAGRTGLARLLIGSVAEKVVRHAPVPVLTVRPPAGRARARRTRRRRRR